MPRRGSACASPGPARRAARCGSADFLLDFGSSGSILKPIDYDSTVPLLAEERHVHLPVRQHPHSRAHDERPSVRAATRRARPHGALVCRGGLPRPAPSSRCGADRLCALPRTSARPTCRSGSRKPRACTGSARSGGPSPTSSWPRRSGGSPTCAPSSREHSVDAVLCDGLMYGVGMVHELGGPPWATFGDGPLPVEDADTPPFGPALLPWPGPLGRLRNRVVRAAGRRLVFAPAQRRYDQIRAALGLPKDPVPVMEASTVSLPAPAGMHAGVRVPAHRACRATSTGWVPCVRTRPRTGGLRPGGARSPARAGPWSWSARAACGPTSPS